VPGWMILAVIVGVIYLAMACVILLALSPVAFQNGWRGPLLWLLAGLLWPFTLWELSDIDIG